jgi:O-antigen ligase
LLLGFSAGTLFLLLTRSRTATFAYFAALLFFFVMTMPRAKRFAVMGFLAMTMIVGILAVLAFDSQQGGHNPFVDAIKMGREQETEDVMSLTGRVQIWQRLLSDAFERPLFGYGYGAFWTPRKIALISQVHDLEISHAQRGSCGAFWRAAARFASHPFGGAWLSPDK